MDQLERINARMRVLLLCQAAGFFAWQAGGGVANAEQLPAALTGVGMPVSLVGFGVWFITLLLYFADARRAYKTVGYDVINDEWSRDVRRRAAEAAFWVITIATVLAMTLSNFGVEGALLLKILTGLSVSSFFVATVIYDQRGDDEGEAELEDA